MYLIDYYRPLKSDGDDFYGQMAAMANEDFDSEEEVCVLIERVRKFVLLYVLLSLSLFLHRRMSH